MAKEDHKNMMSYLRQADATFQNGFSSEELQRIFLQNTFAEISGSEAQFCLQKSFSFILENMLKKAELDVAVNFFERIKEEWKEIACSPGGCHVLQCLYERIITCVYKSKLKSDDCIMKRVAALAPIFDVSPAADRITETIKGPHSTYAFRYHMQMLGGILLSNSKSGVEKDIRLGKENMPKGFLKKLRNICEALCSMPDKGFVEFLSDAQASPSIACVLEIVGKRRMPKTLKLLCEKIISCCEDVFFVLMKDKHASHVFESLLQHGTLPVKKHIQKTLFKDDKMFFELCTHPNANFVIQRFVECFDEEDDFKEVFNFVSEGLEDILSGQNYGIIQKLCEQCTKFETCQRDFYDKLLEAFHCETAADRETLILLLACLRTHDSYFENNSNGTITNVEYHGTVLLQALLKFQNVGLLVKSMCSISVENIVALCCHSCGSHFIDAFFTSDKVKFKIKQNLLKKLENEWAKLACDKYGSRVLENIWDTADIPVKRLLAEVLAKDSAVLLEDNFGQFIHRKCQLKRYQTRLDEWESVQKQLTKKRKMFEGIVPESKLRKIKSK